ncbi:MAG: F0F1 ATP synthase subunit A [Planctomycetes bacterium]|nr:F0F1 ATP synthase subunit A [Planctomycetota bacterium]
MRIVVALLLIIAAAYVGTNYTPHHASDPAAPFVPLFSHLMPAPLVSNPAGVELGEMPQYLVPPITVPLADTFDAAPELPGTQFVFTNLQLFQVLAVLLIFVCFSGVPRYLRTGKGDSLSKIFAGFAMWVRDEMVYAVMGKEVGKKFLPYILSLFFFILFMNVIGLFPGTATATASVFVTAGLALLTLVVMVFGGMIAQGPITYWKTLVPHVPWFVYPIMLVVELVGILVKPFALMIRLFANMTGGHMVVLSFMGLLFLMAHGMGQVAYAGSLAVVPFAVFIMIIESFVALLQAYVFTMLSILFIQASIHPEH